MTTREKICLALLLLGVSLMYGLTLYPGIGGRIYYGDSVKWQFLWAVGGTPHSTGYPLFLAITKMFGELFVCLEPYRRISLVSLVFGVGSLIPIYLITAQFTSRLGLRLAAPALLAFSATYWSQSTEPEVYTLSIFLSAVSIHFLLLYVANSSLRMLSASLLVYAISFGNHLTVAMLFPAFAYAILSSPRRQESIRMILMLLPPLFLLSVGQYAYIYHLSHAGGQHLEYVGSHVGLRRLIDYVTGGQFKGRFGSTFASPRLLIRQLAKLLATFHRDLRLPLFLVAGYAMVACARLPFKNVALDTRQKRKMVLFFAATFQLFFALSYPIPDIETYYLSVYAWLIPLSVAAVDDFLCLSRAGALKSAPEWVAVVLAATLTVQWVVGFHFNKPGQNSVQALAEEIFRLVPESSALFTSCQKNYELCEALWYFSVLGDPAKKIRITDDEPIYTLVSRKPMPGRQDAYVLQRMVKGVAVEETLVVPQRSPSP